MNRPHFDLLRQAHGTLLTLGVAAALIPSLPAQTHADLQGSVQRIKVHGKGLEGNLSGDPARRIHRGANET